MIVPSAAAILEQLADKNAQVLNLLALCRTKPYEAVWLEGPQLLRRFARLLLKQGNPTLALEVAARGLDKTCYPGDHELLYCRALALVNSGNATRAEQFVQELILLPGLEPQLLSDALALAGRVRKVRASRTADLTLFREARDCYLRAYELTGDTFPGINAASLSLLAGEPEPSRALAAKVRDAVLTLFEQEDKENDYWALATLGEAYLLLSDATGAKGRYGQAVRLARAANAFGDIASMRRQLLLLRPHLPLVEDLLGLFHIGPVVVFAGHNLDHPGDNPPRFPADRALEKAVRSAIKHELDAIESNIGYCTPGCGSDILFGELMRERNAELHVVLPFEENDFLAERVTYIKPPKPPSWRQRYKKLRGHLRVTTHSATTEEFLDDQVLYDFAGTFMQGLALTRAEQVGVETIALVVQDSTPKPGSSGLKTFVKNWKKTGHALRIIDLAGIRRRVRLSAPQLGAAEAKRRKLTPKRAVMAMLFADVAGFSGLPEIHLPAFFEAFLKDVDVELQATPALFQNTWGDGLYIVYKDVVSCADFALRLLRRLESFDFNKFKFKLKEDKQPGVRIGLHTGPVFKGFDAVLQRDNYFGSHVSRAARIEPVTAPGCAFVSEQFAAALALAPKHDFVCEYLGLQPLAKDYDICPLYRLTKR